MSLENPNTRPFSTHRTDRPAAVAPSLPDAAAIGPLLRALVLFRDVAQTEHVARFPLLVLVDAPQIPDAHGPVFAACQAYVVLDLHALHRPAVSA